MKVPSSARLKSALAGPDAIQAAATFLQAASELVFLDQQLLEQLLPYVLGRQAQGDGSISAAVIVVELAAACGALSSSKLEAAVEDLLAQQQDACASKVLLAAVRAASTTTFSEAESLLHVC